LIVSAPFFVLAFGFSNLAMLGWLAAAAAPLLIHLWSRHRFREAPWAAMQFLLAALRKNSRRLQIQQWLLLALRTLLIAVVVLAVAEPYGRPLAVGGASAPAHKVLVVDGSLSMAYRDGDTSRFARAKGLAAELVRRSRAGDSFTVILMARPAKTIVGHETVDRDEVRAQIESLAQTHLPADVLGALDLVESSLAEASKDSRVAKRYEVHFFTDMQRSTWQDTGSGSSRKQNNAISNAPTATSEINTRLAALVERAAVTMIDVGQTGAQNLAVTRMTPSERLVTGRHEIGIEAALRHFGVEPRPACSVELLVDDVPVRQQTVDVPAGGEATLRFSYRFNSPGEHTVEVRAAADRLSVDDSRWLVLPVREEIRVLCVAGREGAANYVADALNPNPQAPTAIRPTIVSDGQLAELQFADFDCIFLCNVAELAPSEAARLTQYVAEGGGVVFFLGDRVNPTSYNAVAPGGRGVGRAKPSGSQQAGDSLTLDSSISLSEFEQPLLPARIGDAMSRPQFGIDPLNYRHPIVAPFRGRERAGLLTTPLTRYFRLDISQSSDEAQVAAALRDGDPLIVTATLGRGRTAIVATDGSLSSVDPATGEPWNLWPTWPSYLPIVRELLAYVGGSDGQLLQQIAGDTLHGYFADLTPDVAAHRPLQVTRPDGAVAFANIETTSDGAEWSFDDTDVSGVYSLRGIPETIPRQFAVNTDTTESDLARIGQDELPSKLVSQDAIQIARDSGDRSNSVVQAAWSQSLLWAALAIMFLESLVAWHFGRGGT
jgi:hypothetical protein